ncbi:Beta-phosphoglucomutase [Spironucleus salmonicida]|uniref:Beta-phosphoglucomutase n=1 Tax=Spironucleus salmonicida TaxID=348837 RepID=V6LAV1_9EUKA|nr:Beta-phosphoglucomutase [Spironucleus salmonicida]|eukprot:EST41353.1 Hydrolase, haloacid dehalogenase-like family [Spironucleus salmonicida]
MEQIINQAEAIIFDFDGTLVDTNQIWLDTDNVIKAEFGLNFDMDHYLPLIQGNIFMHICEEIVSYYKPKTDAITLKNRYFEVYKSFAAKSKLVPGAKEYMQKLQVRGSKYAIASANPTELNSHIFKTHEISHLAPEIFVSCDDVGKGKPSPDVFLEAAKQLNVDITKCVVFEDSIVGVQAAKASGAVVVCIGQKGRDLADFCIDDYLQLIQ